MDELRGKGEALFVRVYVVLHGNQSEGPLHEKPGVATWTKHVAVKRVPKPDTRNADNYLPDKFNQEDVSVDIVGHVSDNVSNDANKYVGVFLDGLKGALNSLNCAAFIEVG